MGVQWNGCTRSLGLATTFRILAGATTAKQYVGKNSFISHPYLVIFKLGGPSESAAYLVIN